MADGYAQTYQELVETTDWSKYGRGQRPALRQLHGALRLRADGGAGDDEVAEAVDAGRAQPVAAGARTRRQKPGDAVAAPGRSNLCDAASGGGFCFSRSGYDDQVEAASLSWLRMILPRGGRRSSR